MAEEIEAEVIEPKASDEPKASREIKPISTSASREVAPIIPKSTSEITRIAAFLVKAGALPKSYKDDEGKAAIAIMKGLELGWLPMMAVQNMYVINGMPTIYGDGALALVRRSGFLESIREFIDGEGDARIARCIVIRKGEEPVERTFSINDAIKTKLLGKDIWQQYTTRMLQMRARAFALRDVFPDVLLGLRITEEVQDYEREETPKSAINPFADAPVLSSEEAPAETNQAVIEP